MSRCHSWCGNYGGNLCYRLVRNQCLSYNPLYNTYLHSINAQSKQGLLPYQEYIRPLGIVLPSSIAFQFGCMNNLGWHMFAEEDTMYGRLGWWDGELTWAWWLGSMIAMHRAHENAHVSQSHQGWHCPPHCSHGATLLISELPNNYWYSLQRCYMMLSGMWRLLVVIHQGDQIQLWTIAVQGECHLSILRPMRWIAGWCWMTDWGTAGSGPWHPPASGRTLVMIYRSLDASALSVGGYLAGGSGGGSSTHGNF